MIQLQPEYILRGRPEWKYKVIRREGDVVIAEQHRIDRIKNNEEEVMDENTFQGYEVFVVQKYPERKRPDGAGMIPAKELPPPDFHWGRYGFSYAGVGGKQHHWQRAEKKFKELQEMKEKSAERKVTIANNKKKAKKATA